MFLALVTRGGKPERPQEGFAIPDDLWILAETCWAVEPNKRPSVDSIRRVLVRHTILHGPPTQQRDLPVPTQDRDELYQQLYQQLTASKEQSRKLLQDVNEERSAEEQVREQLQKEHVKEKEQ